MQNHQSLIGSAATFTDVADSHRWKAYRDFFTLEPEGPAPAFHWLLFSSLPAETRDDGHASVMTPFPPMPWPRRMWAGGEVRWRAPIGEGDALTRCSTITRAEPKQGASGDFLLTSLQHEIARGDMSCISERQDIVFLPAATQPGSAAPRPIGFVPDWTRPVSFGPVDLFRYSALTLNSHRIHYDAAYAREVEHHAGLVVHGPLLATTLLHAALGRHGGGLPHHFSYRAVGPAYSGEQLHIAGRSEGNTMRLAIVGPDEGVRTAGTLAFGDPG